VRRPPGGRYQSILLVDGQGELFTATRQWDRVSLGTLPDRRMPWSRISADTGSTRDGPV
jgi:hypothetical protein